VKRAYYATFLSHLSGTPPSVLPLDAINLKMYFLSGVVVTVWWSHLPFTIGFHQFVERSVPLDLELHHRAILPCHFQVDVLIALGLHSLLKETKHMFAAS